MAIFSSIVLGLALLFSTIAMAQEPCADKSDPLTRAGFEIPEGSGRRVDFPIGKTAAELRGPLTDQEKKDIASDKIVWEKMRLIDSRVKPTKNDSVLYPASGVDFGLPINTIGGAALYIGVDKEETFSNTQVLNWADSKFDASKLFSDHKYVATIPYMITGDAGSGPDFAKSHLKNLACALPDDATVESVSFILDYKPVARWYQADKTPQPVGPHVVVTWCYKGVKQSSLLISGPMPDPMQGRGIWWYERIEKLRPSYGVMKRPQGFSFDEVFGQMCEWTKRKGGYILSEGGKEDSTAAGKPAVCLKQASYKRHELSAKDVGRSGEGRDGKIFGFDDKAVLIEVFGTKGSPADGKPMPPRSNHKN